VSRGSEGKGGRRKRGGTDTPTQEGKRSYAFPRIPFTKKPWGGKTATAHVGTGVESHIRKNLGGGSIKGILGNHNLTANMKMESEETAGGTRTRFRGRLSFGPKGKKKTQKMERAMWAPLRITRQGLL